MDGKKTLGLIFLFSLLSTSVLTSAVGNAAEKQEGVVDDTHAKLSKTVQQIANGIDSFFVSDRHMTWEENRSAITLRLDTDFIEHHGVDVSPKIKLHLQLPGLKNFSLVANEDENDGGESNPDADDESSFALRWTGINTDRYGLSFDLGLRVRDSNWEGFGRVNAEVEYPLGPTWMGRSTNRLYYYTDAGWRNDFRQYFERKISDDFLLRSRTRLQYFEEFEDRLYPEQKFTLYQRLGRKSVLAYELVGEVIPGDDSLFDDDEILEVDEEYTRYLAQLRYRTNIWKPWLFIELWPGVAFPEERDYDTTLFARVRVDITFGRIFGGQATIDE
jgi:hypothetical protein